MASITYSKKLPDYGDLDNMTGNHPGYNVYVRENDGGIGMEFLDAREDKTTGIGHSVFLNVAEAKELIKGIQKAIDRAEPKKTLHKNRAQDC